MSISDLSAYKCDRLQGVMHAHQLDVLIASLPENIRYMTDYTSISSRAEYFSLQNRDGERALVCGVADAGTVAELLTGISYFPHGTFFFHAPGDDPFSAQVRRAMEKSAANPAAALCEAIASLCPRGGKGARVGLDETRIKPHVWQAVHSAFPEAEIVPAAAIFYEARRIKHPAEVARLERVVEIAELALAAAVAAIRPGATELDLEKAYLAEVIALGARPLFQVMTADKRGAFVDTINRDNPIREGSVVRFDIGCIWQHYRSDISRTVCVGTVAPKTADLYAAIWEVERAAIAAIKPGVAACDIFRIAMDTVRKGIPHYQRQHCGHGIGLEIYDLPTVSANVTMPLEEGMVLCIETPYYEIGWGGVQVEDTLVVTRDGCRIFNKTSGDLILHPFS